MVVKVCARLLRHGAVDERRPVGVRLLVLLGAAHAAVGRENRRLIVHRPQQFGAVARLAVDELGTRAQTLEGIVRGFALEVLEARSGVG